MLVQECAHGATQWPTRLHLVVGDSNELQVLQSCITTVHCCDGIFQSTRVCLQFESCKQCQNAIQTDAIMSATASAANKLALPKPPSDNSLTKSGTRWKYVELDRLHRIGSKYNYTNATLNQLVSRTKQVSFTST